MSRRLPLSVYLPSLTSLLLVAGLCGYYLLSVSARAQYYDERAFRVLSLLGSGLSETSEGVRTVLGASTKYWNGTKDGDKTAKEYLESVLADQNVRDIQSVDARDVGRDGILRLSPLQQSPAFTVRAEYSQAGTVPDAQYDIGACRKDRPSLCATVDLAPVLSTQFEQLGDAFFDDVLVADAQGRVWYQHSPNGSRVAHLAPLIAGAGQSGVTRTPERSSAEARTAENRQPSPRPVLVGSFSTTIDVTIAGARGRLYLSPLAITLDGPAGPSRMVIGAFRRMGDDNQNTTAVPHTFMIWGTLAVLTSFTLLWPVLKVSYMSSKERLQRKHMAYLLASVFASTAFLTLLILNASYTASERDRTRDQLQALAERIKSNFDVELHRAVRFLDRTSPDHFVHELKPRDGLRQQTRVLNPGTGPGLRDESYPYFHYLFWVDSEGRQQVKLTVPDRATPQTVVKKEAYFNDVLNNELATLQEPGRAAGKPLRLRVEPVYSPNTHEFFAVVAMPADPAGRDRQVAALRLKAKVLVTKFESLVDPLFPPGFGFAVVDPTGHVKFHSNSARNLQENFVKEAQGDRALVALLSQAGEGSLRMDYMGRTHELFVMPLTDVTRDPLSVIVFRDDADFSTVNAGVILVFAFLMILYALPFALLLPLHTAKQEYPLDVIWPCSTRVPLYAHLLVAYGAVLLVFSLTYARAEVVDCVLRWPMLLAYVGVVYPALQGDSRPTWLKPSAQCILALGLVWFARQSWVMVIPLAFSVACLPKVERAIGDSARGMRLRHLYALVTLSTLLVVVVAPACALFRFSHDAVQRLAVAREATLLANARRDRAERLDGYYSRIARPDLGQQRRKEELDRYDLVPKVKVGAAVPLRLTRTEAAIAAVCARLPMNPMAAELQRLAITGTADARKVWKVASGALILLPSERRDGNESIVLPVPFWDGLRPEAALVLGVVIVGLFLWFTFVTRIVFLIDLPNAPKLESWDVRKKPGDANLVVLGRPKSGRRRVIESLPGIQMIDLAQLETNHLWTQVALTSQRVGVHYFDFDLDSPSTNYRKLQLLERLLFVEHVGVILLSNVDPMYYLASYGPQERADGLAAPMSERLERWAAVLSRLRKVRLSTRPSRAFEIRRLCGNGDPNCLRALDCIQRECDAHEALSRIGRRILRRTQARPITRDLLIELLLDRADSYYRLLWSRCTADERLVLFQLARDGWANPKNATAIQHLQRRSLIVRPRGFQIMNESFRRFVLKSQYPLDVKRWESEERQSVWRALRLSLGVAGVFLAAWIVYTHPDAMTVVIASVGGVAALIGGLMKIIGDLKSPFIAASAVRTGG